MYPNQIKKLFIATCITGIVSCAVMILPLILMATLLIRLLLPNNMGNVPTGGADMLLFLPFTLVGCGLGVWVLIICIMGLVAIKQNRLTLERIASLATKHVSISASLVFISPVAFLVFVVIALPLIVPYLVLSIILKSKTKAAIANANSPTASA